MGQTTEVTKDEMLRRLTDIPGPAAVRVMLAAITEAARCGVSMEIRGEVHAITGLAEDYLLALEADNGLRAARTLRDAAAEIQRRGKASHPVVVALVAALVIDALDAMWIDAINAWLEVADQLVPDDDAAGSILLLMLRAEESRRAA